ncbi:DivIVA domain-containing protein [Nonomuraea sp. NPDC050153]|uniref:DivIVA domain-containing protein n=1 Tax=Nonomuraea sp. NPDC050153 TaxID=3364359 RepID=UPI0037904818
MNDPVEQFHATYSSRPDNDGDEGGAVARWSEPGGETDASWEEPQWDEPQAAASASSRSPERLTPAQLRAVVFRRAPLGRRGLDEHQVNNLLDRVEEELTLLTQEKKALLAEVALLREYVSDSSAIAVPAQQQQPTPAPRAEADATTPARRETGLSRVEQAGHVESQTVASRMQEAHVYAASLLSQAQQTADQYIQDAQRYARELIEDARYRRGEILSKAGPEQATPEEETWEREAARLRAASQQYRGKLRDYFELLLMNLDEWETAEEIGGPPDTGRLPE